STAVLVLPPALSRMLLVIGVVEAFPAALQWSLVMTELVALALVVADRRGGRVHPPYPLLLAFLVLQHASLSWLPATAAWQAVCRWIAGVA
ncbi:MAG TPA: hypothetical protein VN581_06605, partial [Patescibacteria group bacterium]|nr:hypothetical protein [Patescibacteria group bacterium]